MVGRRSDGYHLLDSLVVFAGVADRIEAERAPTLTLRLSGPGAPTLRADPAENLVLRAARALAREAGVAAGASVTLRKTLPVASGIGGGSADAAAALRLLARLWGVALPPARLSGLAASLGADVPVCLAARPARMGGIGEVLDPAPALPEFGLVLVNPGVAVSTPAVFRAREPGFSEPAALPGGWAAAPAMATQLAATRNDLQAPAIALCPVIGEALAALAALPGCLLARMSGSGATCFGLFADPEAALRAAAALPAPAGWWVWGGAPWTAPLGDAIEADHAAA